jgi:hypothetical protein
MFYIKMLILLISFCQELFLFQYCYLGESVKEMLSYLPLKIVMCSQREVLIDLLYSNTLQYMSYSHTCLVTQKILFLTNDGIVKHAITNQKETVAHNRVSPIINKNHKLSSCHSISLHSSTPCALRTK